MLIWRDLKKALRGAWVEKREKEMRIVLPGGGSVQVKSADDPDALRGVGLDGVVLDEAAFMKEEAWFNGIRPALSDRQGWALFLTTPSGMNWIHALFETAGCSEDWARWQRPTSENPIVPPEELEAARRDMGELQFAQEHLAQFVTAGAGMFKPDWFAQRYQTIAPGVFALPDGNPAMLCTRLTSTASSCASGGSQSPQSGASSRPEPHLQPLPLTPNAAGKTSPGIPSTRRSCSTRRAAARAQRRTYEAVRRGPQGRYRDRLLAARVLAPSQPPHV